MTIGLMNLATACDFSDGVVEDDDDERPPDGDGPDDLPGDPFEAAPEPALLDEPARAALAANIDSILNQGAVAGATQSVTVMDLETGQVLYTRAPELSLIPASNTKLFSTGVAIDILGEDHRMVTSVYRTPAGDLVLVGDHDFSWSSFLAQGPRRPLDVLAAELAAAGVTSVGQVIVAGEVLFDGERFGTYNAATNRSQAATAFQAALSAAGISSAGVATQASFDPPDGSTLMATYESLPISAGAVPLNTLSHNEFADILVRHVGSELAGESSYGAGGAEIDGWLDTLGVFADGASFSDGSGLSRQNQVSSRTVVEVLGEMLNRPGGPAYRRTLSIAGIRGTLGARMTGARTAGRFFGKTGTLNGVIATSGYLFHATDSRRYGIGILMNNVGDANGARAVQDQVVSAVAADLRGEPAPPAAPTFLAAINDRSNLVEMRWTEVAGATGYILWLSRDGRTWDRSEARLVTGTSHKADGLGDGVRFARVTTLGPGGESEPSDVLATVSARSASRVLLVDGNDRYQADPAIENPAGLGHDFAVAYAGSLAAVGFDTAANEEVESGAVALDHYDAVVWMLGEESTEHETLSRGEQMAIAAYLAGGGQLLISGAEIGWDLVDQGDAMDAAFFLEVLRADYVADSAGSYLLAGMGGPLVTDQPIEFYNPGVLDVIFADAIAPGAGSEPVLGYGGGAIAGVLHDGDYRTATFGFPLEAVPGEDARRRLIEPVLAAFGLLE